MTDRISRRWALGAIAAGVVGSVAFTAGVLVGGRNRERRIADRGDGTFLNPIFPGDRPDPSILRDGNVYYLTFSSFDAYPGLMIWRSHDLVNWEPVGPALTSPIGSVWAPDLIKHDGRYFVYFWRSLIFPEHVWPLARTFGAWRGDIRLRIDSDALAVQQGRVSFVHH